MPKKISIEDVEKQQAKVVKLALKLKPNLKLEEREALTQEIVESASKLEKTAMAFEHQESLSSGETGNTDVPRLIVDLNPDQRKRIFERTGLNIEAIKIDDPGGERTQTMPPTPPEMIEMQATILAQSICDFNKTFSELEKSADEDTLELLRLVKNDPDFKNQVIDRVIFGKKKIT